MNKLTKRCGAALLVTVLFWQSATATQGAEVGSVSTNEILKSCGAAAVLDGLRQEEIVDLQAPVYYLYYDVPLDESIQDYIWSACELYEITDYYSLIIALIVKESQCDASAISATNDYGLMQINKGNHSYLHNKLGTYDMLNPYQNVHAGVYMFANLLHKYGDVSKALMCYNMGEGNAEKLFSKGIYESEYSKDIIIINNNINNIINK